MIPIPVASSRCSLLPLEHCSKSLGVYADECGKCLPYVDLYQQGQLFLNEYFIHVCYFYLLRSTDMGVGVSLCAFPIFPVQSPQDFFTGTDLFNSHCYSACSHLVHSLKCTQTPPGYIFPTSFCSTFFSESSI